MSANQIRLQVNSIDGEAQETPPTIEFFCDHIIPIGTQILKDYDENYSIVANRLFLFNYKGRMFGTFQFKSVADFIQKKDGMCKCCVGCGTYQFTLNSCGFTLFGCQLTFGNP